jgi:hypothetical protein
VNPPLPVLDHVQILREIMVVYESSLLGDEKPSERDAGFKRILDVMVDPAFEMCSAASEEKQRLRAQWDKHVFVLNCLTYLQVSLDLFLFLAVVLMAIRYQSALESFPFTADKQKEIQVVIEERMETLTEEHVGAFIVIQVAPSANGLEYTVRKRIERYRT